MILSPKDAAYMASLVQIRAALSQLLPTTVKSHAKIMNHTNESLVNLLLKLDEDQSEANRKQAVAHE